MRRSPHIPVVARALSVLMAAVLALSSATLALARTAPPGLTVTLCTGGGGEASIMLDARGRPVAPVHPCPDCTAALTLAPPPAPPSAAAPAVRRAPAPPARARIDPSQPSPVPPARGPPAA